MIHFIPESPDIATPLETPYAEAVARLASIRRALACVEQVGGTEPSHRDSEARLALGWQSASDPARRCFEGRSGRTAAAAAAGLEAIAAQSGGREVNQAAVECLSRELAAGLDQIDVLFSL